MRGLDIKMWDLGVHRAVYCTYFPHLSLPCYILPLFSITFCPPFFFLSFPNKWSQRHSWCSVMGARWRCLDQQPWPTSGRRHAIHHTSVSVLFEISSLSSPLTSCTICTIEYDGVQKCGCRCYGVSQGKRSVMKQLFLWQERGRYMPAAWLEQCWNERQVKRVHGPTKKSWGLIIMLP